MSRMPTEKPISDGLPPHSDHNARDQAFQPIPKPPHPDRVGAYHILETIGEGGMGLVYKAEQREPIKRLVALKLIKLGMDSNQIVARFESERQALALMTHPNVARVLDAGTTDTGRPYFVMEYVAGQNITQFCDSQRYSIEQRLELFEQACAAVTHAHQKAIIHRDLKPSNILVTLQDDKPIVKVIDFGLAKAMAQKLTDRTLYTEAGQLVGTREYMSPEQADFDSQDIDTRADIYSLGVVLYELLAGAMPFKSFRGTTYAEMQRIIREVDPPRPSTKLRGLDEAVEVARRRQTEPAQLQRELKRELEWIPLKAMRKERSERYATVAELSQDVENYLRDRPLIAAPESRMYRLRKLLRRNKGPVAAGASIFLLLVAGITGTTIGLVGQSRQRVIAENEAAQQQAVNSFVDEMLSAADPDRMLGDRVTVLQATELASQRIEDGALKDQPSVEAAVRATIGGTLFSLSRYDQAEVMLRRALELRRASLPANHPLIARSLNNLGTLRRARGEFDEAERCFREALQIRRNTLPANHPDLAKSLNDLALLLQERRRLAEAEPLLREALEIYRKSLPSGQRSLATSINNMALLRQAQGNLVEAEQFFREGLELRRAALPAGHPDVAASLSNLGLLLRAQRRFAEAEPLFRDALLIWRSAMPAGHRMIGIGLNNLALVLRDQQKFAEAEPLFRETVDIYRKTVSPGHPDLATVLFNFGLLRQDQGEVAEAEALIREAVQIRRTALGAAAASTTQAATGLANVLEKTGRQVEADSLRDEFHLPVAVNPTTSPSAP